MSAAPAVLTPVTALAVAGVSKSFAGVPALRAVDLSVGQGRVHALLGGNGSGKSTLIKVLAGVHPADAGEVTVRGRRIDAARGLTPAVAAEAGLRFVHQDLALLEDLTVAENLALQAGYPLRRGRIDRRGLRRWTAEVLERFEVAADPDDLVRDLRPATRTMVAIARALRTDGTGTDGDSTHGGTGGAGGLLVLDEPTASLPDHEVEVLLEAVRRRAAAGATVLYVSHRLGEVLSIADDVTVLRDGRRLATLDVAADAVDERALVELIAGHRVDLAAAPRPHRAADRRDEAPALEVRGLRAGAVRGLDLVVAPGEVVGLAGLLGAGKSSVLRAVFGDLPLGAGTLRVGGAEVSALGREARIGRGVAMVPEDRARDAVFPDLPVRENLSVTALRDRGPLHGLRRGAERREALALAERFTVRLASVEQPVETLSGGNQQKVVLARWLRRGPRLLLLDEPTQGVDVGARAEIYDLVRAAAAEGAGVLVASSDPEELAVLCHRVTVLRDGLAVASLAGTDLTARRITQLGYHDDAPGESA